MVRMMLAREQHRTHHHLWHFVRNRTNWEGLSGESRSRLTQAGWAPPRFEEEPGAGLDFLGMHRQMIAMTDAAMAQAGDPTWPRVKGWDPIPWAEDNPDWPVPDWQTQRPPWASAEQWARYTEIAHQARSPERVAQMRSAATLLRDPNRLRSMTLDELGSTMEWSIHGWMHIRWSGSPHGEEFSPDANNNWLFVPWSSHVNKHFWKLHGWIDERIGDWERARGDVADLSDAWAGPAGTLPDMPHSADAELLTALPPREEMPLPMETRQPVVEGLLGGKP